MAQISNFCGDLLSRDKFTCVSGFYPDPGTGLAIDRMVRKFITKEKENIKV